MAKTRSQRPAKVPGAAAPQAGEIQPEVKKPEVAGEVTKTHPVTGAEVKEPIYVPSMAFPVNPNVNQAPMAQKGDYIVEWVEKAVKVEHIQDKDGRTIDDVSTNRGRMVPMLHTMVIDAENYEDPKAAAEKIAAKKKGAKIYRK